MAFPRRALHGFGSTRLSSARACARLLLIGLASTTAVGLLPAAAHADPKLTAAGAQAQLQSLSDKAEALVEKFDAAQERLAAAQRALAADKNAIAIAQHGVDVAKGLVAGVATAAYESGTASTVQVLLASGDPQSVLQRAGTLSMLATRRGQQLRTATAARNKLTQAQAAATQQLKTIQALQASLGSQQKQIDALVAQQQSLLKASQAQIAAEDARATAAARTAAAAARASRSAPRVAVSQPIAPVVAGGRAAAAVRYAYAQLGKPYRYGAAGPAAFDCSGLTMRAWQAAGVSISHNAAAQYASTAHVSRSQLQPGDLVYFGHPIHHVGIYIGGGNMIEAPYTGADVRITNFGYRTDYAGASRP